MRTKGKRTKKHAKNNYGNWAPVRWNTIIIINNIQPIRRLMFFNESWRWIFGYFFLCWSFSLSPLSLSTHSIRQSHVAETILNIKNKIIIMFICCFGNKQWFAYKIMNRSKIEFYPLSPNFECAARFKTRKSMKPLFSITFIKFAACRALICN